MTTLKKVHMLRCAASFVVATYDKKYVSLLMLCAPCLWSFLQGRISLKYFVTRSDGNF